ncbi:GNAT family N-acetyltransferase [uncultured Psychroserpens sp.]|uniref:GNAT family N-acetyltransferase n=1 Tax=uncultured Psychroserpens sp. TaxID=255436 RepID=UPI002628B3B0|nr:GNAT family N-acetyltransferase [uncultured Psychroserpens sp.]
MHQYITNRLKFRKLTFQDHNSLFKILGDDKTMLFYPAPYNYKEVKQWINRNMNSYKEHGFGLWALELNKTGEFIGQCGVTYQNIDNAVLPEIGFHIHKNHQNKGLATEAAKAVIKYAKDNLNFNEIFINTYCENRATQIIAEKIGMQKVKEYDKCMNKNDVFWEHYLFQKKL